MVTEPGIDKVKREVQEWHQQLGLMSNEEKAILVMKSPAMHFATSVQITDKRNRLIKPIPNILQLRMSQAYEVCMELGVPCRMICCKPRQVGCSTFASDVIYCHEQGRRVNGITISDVKDNSKKLMQKISDYESRDTFPWGNKMRSTAGSLDWTNGSHHEVDSAENWKAGIGDTRQAFHASEIGKWPKTGVKNDKRVMSAVLPSIASEPGTVVIAESTPDGAVGWMYETYQNAVTLDEFIELYVSGKDTGTKWIKVFAGWWEFVEHQREVTPLERAELIRTCTAREREGQNRFGWTAEQIAWRRDKLREECGEDEDVFDEYYPEDDVRCWLVSGRPRFHMGMLCGMERVAMSTGVETGYLVEQTQGQLGWSRDPGGNGDIQVWEPPREGCRYLVACDPATGADQTGGKNPDRSSIQVWKQGYYDPDTEKEYKAMLVARVRPPFFGDADQVAGHISRLSKWYGGALAVLEVNMGLGVLELLKHLGVPLYMREVQNERVGSKTKQYGYKLKDVQQRRTLVDALAVAIREGEIDVRCEHWIDEAKKFVITPSGKEEAQAGAHDDDVMCGAMAWLTIPSASEYRRIKRRRKRPRDGWKRVGDHWNG